MERRTKVYGPYSEERGWRVVLVEHGEEGGKRSTRWFASEEAACKFIADVQEELKLEGPITVEEALEEYEAYLVAKGNRSSTVSTTMQRLRRMLDVHGERQGRPVLGRVGGRDTYAKVAAALAADTHRNILSEAKTFGKWAVKRGYLRMNPWEKVEPLGKKKRGKAQLRVDEARKWLAKATELAEKGDEGAVAAMMTLLLGLRASEVIERVRRDVDDGGALLWIDHAKTEAGRRVVDVPEMLRGLLRRMVVDDEMAGDRIFAHDRHWVRAQVKRICRLAGIPEVGAHGMRGTMASIASASGAATQLVAATLGHAGTAVTLAHYARPDAVAAGTQGRGLAVLAGGKR